MRWGRPIVLLVIAATVGGLVYEGNKSLRKPTAAEHPITFGPNEIAKLVVTFGKNQIVLESPKANEWVLPGNWPVRQAEARELARLVAIHDTRFEPEEIGNKAEEWAARGLDKPVVTAELTPRGGKAPVYIAFGVAPTPTGANKFSEPTYARFNDKPTAYRLAPGLVDQITRPLDYYRQRRLFAGTKPPRDPEAGVPRPGEPIRREQLAGKEIKLEQTSPTETKAPAPVVLVREGQGAFAAWKLKEPGGPDNLNPTAADTLLSSVPDLWAERFYTDAEAPVSKTGLDKPTKVIRVTADNGQTTRLLIGSISRTRSYKKPRALPPGAPPGFPAGEETATEEFRFAKLEANPQVFEIKAAGLSGIFAGPETLRDPNPVRFQSADATKIEVTPSAGGAFSLVKKDSSWLVERQGAAPMAAETGRVNDLLSRLSGLDARDKDLIAPSTPEKLKETGLEKPGTVLRVHLKETAANWPKDEAGNRPTRERVVTVKLGRRDEKSKKLALAVEGINRINEVDDALFATATRPALAYRDRKVLNLAASKIQSISLQPKGAKDPVLLSREGKDSKTWILSGAVKTGVDESLATQFANAVAEIEAAELVSESVDAKTLASEYGIDDASTRIEIRTEPEPGKPAAPVILRLGKAKPPEAKADQPPRVPGQPAPPEEKPTYYARIEGKPELFLVSSDLQNQATRPLLNWLPSNPLNVTADEIQSIKVQKPGQPQFVLQRKGLAPLAPDRPLPNGWTIKEPFDADAPETRTDPFINGLASFKAEYQSLKADAALEAAFGAKATRITIARKDKPELVLELGEAQGKAVPGRIVGQSPVFQAGAELQTIVAGLPLNLLDPVGLAIDTSRVESVQFTLGKESHDLTRLPGPPPLTGGSGWVVKDKAQAMPADTEAVSTLLGTLFNLRGGRIIDYGAKVDPKKYGLDQPTARLKIQLKAQEGGATPANPSQPAKLEHLVDIGSEVKDEPGARYGRFDGGQAVVSLPAAIVAAIERKPLDLVDRVVARVDGKEVQKIRLIRDKDTVEVVREGDNWKQASPAAIGADSAVVVNWLGDFVRLRCDKVVAFKPTDAKALGLEPPFAKVEIESKGGDGKMVTTRLLIGKNSGSGRLVRVEGGDVVGEIGSTLMTRLLPNPLFFRNRGVATVLSFDGAQMERGPRKFTLGRSGPFWKMTAPTNAEIDTDALGPMFNELARLKVDEFVADKATPEKLKEFGLEKPVAKWTLTQAGKDVFVLNLGNRLADGRVYGRLGVGNGDLLFLLGSEFSGRLLGEIRTNRNVWGESGLDALQIETIRIVPRTGEPIMLMKKENGWEAAGKPDAKILTETVNDTLGSLAGLRLERYAADKGGDPKLFGLEPAEYLVEISGRVGLRTLKLGSREEGTDRRYAISDKTPAGEILVLSESDTRRILRKLADFGKPPPFIAPAANAPPPLDFPKP